MSAEDSVQSLTVPIGKRIISRMFNVFGQPIDGKNSRNQAEQPSVLKNIAEIQDHMLQSFNRLRKKEIDEELSDLVNGFEVLVTAIKQIFVTARLYQLSLQI